MNNFKGYIFVACLTLGVNMHAMDNQAHSISKEHLAIQMYESGIINFGEFKLKSGTISPAYIDLRRAMSCPEFFKNLIQATSEVILSKGIGVIATSSDEGLSYACITLKDDVEVLCGVPYGALPLTAGIALQLQKPMIMLRKEGAKAYGMQQEIEGKYDTGAKCLLIEDVMTTGSSVDESAEKLKNKLTVNDVLVVMDREQGGKAMLESKGYRVHSLFTITELINILYDAKKINEEMYRTCINWINQHKK